MLTTNYGRKRHQHLILVTNTFRLQDLSPTSMWPFVRHFEPVWVTKQADHYHVTQFFLDFQDWFQIVSLNMIMGSHILIGWSKKPEKILMKVMSQVILILKLKSTCDGHMLINLTYPSSKHPLPKESVLWFAKNIVQSNFDTNRIKY